MTYFFQSYSGVYSNDFKLSYKKQNLAITFQLATSLFIVCLLLLLSTFVVAYPIYMAPGTYQHLYKLTQYFVLTQGLIAFITGYIYFSFDKEEWSKFNFFTALFAISFIGGCIWLSFVAQRQPSNTLTMILLSKFTTAILFVLSLEQLLWIIGLSFLLFTLGLEYFQLNASLWLTNYITYLLVLTAFGVLSRIQYTNRLKYFLKLKMIEEKNAEVERISRLKSEILGVVAHDLRSPLNNIKSLLYLIQEADEQHEKEEYLSLIEQTCKKADFIIEDLISTARDNSDQIDIGLKQSLNQFLRNCNDGWKILNIGRRKIEFQLPPYDIQLSFDGPKLQRALDNLIQNAIKFTPDNGSIIVRLTLHNPHQARIMIKDNGIGIPLDLQPELFERFSKASRKGLKNQPSTGLGLNIVKNIVNQHGGQIHFESTEHQGTTFYIDLPLTND